MNRQRVASLVARSGFTLIELMVVVALVAIVIALAAPSLGNMIVMQRLRGISTQLTTDLQFARSEAVSRQDVVGVSFNPTASGQSCYVVHTCGQPTTASLLNGDCTCNCALSAGSRCTAPRIEIRTVAVASGSGVLVQPVPVSPATSTPGTVTFDPVTGGITAFYPVSISGALRPPVAQFWIDTTLIGATVSTKLRSMLSSTGRPTTCAIGPVSATTPCAP
jgi:prepilin-type N-terminal cleavage/methylation domain-containing protein